MQSSSTSVSIIVVTYNQEENIALCLGAIFRIAHDSYEVIVVDDYSTDRTVEIIKQFPARVVRLSKHEGAATARNRGAQEANGEILFFLDSDVVVAPHVMTEMRAAFQRNPNAQGLQGVYARESAAKNMATQYKDYFNDYKNARIESDIVQIVSTYCFAIKREAFFAVGGFDATIKRATVEDNDLGYRLFYSNHLVLLDRNLVVTHLKKYSLLSMLKRDYVTAFDMVKLLLRWERAKKDNRRIDNALLIPLHAGSATKVSFTVDLIVALASFLVGIYYVCSLRIEYGVFFALLLGFFVAINLAYLPRLLKAKGYRFCAVWLCLFYLDMLCVSFAVLHGGVDFMLFRRRY